VLTAKGSMEQKSFHLMLKDDAETTLSGSAFQLLAAATGKAQLPIVVV